jgi:hypothetical protein
VLATYGTAAILYAASILIGGAVMRAAGQDPWQGHAPATGLALLLIVASIGISLPGRAVTALVAVLLATGVALFLLRGDLPRRPPLDVTLVSLAVLAAVSVPYIANARVGLLGVGYFNDLAVHLPFVAYLTEGPGVGVYAPSPGYPLGPHSLVAAVTQLGFGADFTFNGLLIAIQLLFVTSALPLLDGLSRPRRALGALVVALPYLAVAYYAQGGFKETMMALFALAFAAGVRSLWRSRAFSPRAIVPLAVIAAGSVYAFSYTALGWLFGTLGIWIFLELLFGDSRLRQAARSLRTGVSLRSAPVVSVGVGVGALLVLLLPNADRIADFFDQLSLSPSAAGTIADNALGNLAGPLPAYEVLGLWPRQDFRFQPEAFTKGVVVTIALIVVAYGAVWWLRRRDFVLPAAVLAAAVIYGYLREFESPYLAAKGLAVAAPLVMALAIRPLLDRWPEGARVPEAQLVRAALAAAFIGIALWSSFNALRGAQVGPREHVDELATLRPMLEGSRTLYLAEDDFVLWELRGADVTIPVGTAQAITSPQVQTRPEKAWQYGQPFDLDSVAASELDQFDYVVTSNSRYASEPPANFQAVGTTRSYRVWKRSGETPRRGTLSEGPDPGATLACDTPAGRELSRQDGWARVRPKPVLTQVDGGASGASLGWKPTATLDLAPGRYELSLQYTSPQRVDISGPGVQAELPATNDRPGPFWRFADLRVERRTKLRLTLEVHNPTHLRPQTQVAFMWGLAAVRRDESAQLLRLRKACGRYLDWYTLGRGAPPV